MPLLPPPRSDRSSWADGEQLFLPTIDRIGGVWRQDRRRFVNARGEVGEESLRHRSCLLLRLREIVDGTVPAMDVPAAQLLLRDVVTHGVAHHRRPSHK